MFFESVAHAMGAGGAAGGQSNPIAAFMPLVLMFLIFYFLLIRPQQKKAKQHRELLANLKKGDYVLTGGGLFGRIVTVADDVLQIDLGNDMVVKVARGFVTGLAEAPKDGKKNKPETKAETKADK